MPKDISLLLENAGLKKTRIRLEIIEMLIHSNVLYSAQDLHIELVNKGVQVNLSSVYRTLEKLADVGIINQITLENEKQSMYEFNSHTHHHFLVCDDCNKVVVVEGCPVHDYEDDLAKSYGFNITNHKVEFHGKCSDCQE